MVSVDLNCDMGEGSGNDSEIMPYITSANIACGFHAGNVEIMKDTILLCKKYKVSIGAHPSYPDRNNFGRVDMECTEEQIYNWVFEQVNKLKNIANDCNVELSHVKPHGALYNKASIHSGTAKVIVSAIMDIDKNLVLYGLSGSHLITEAKRYGLRSANEVFADRTYQDDGTLTPRSQKGALIEEEKKSIDQILQMIENGIVKTLSGKIISIVPDTISIHSDGKNAVKFARNIFQTLKTRSIAIKAF